MAVAIVPPLEDIEPEIDESLRGQLRERINDGVSGAVAVKLVLGGVADLDELRRLAFPAVYVQAQRIERELVRRLEQKVDRSIADGADPLTARQELLGKTFALPSGERVEWELATADQHLARAAWQRKMAGNCIEDAERHEAAAAEIKKAKVGCLADLW